MIIYAVDRNGRQFRFNVETGIQVSIRNSQGSTTVVRSFAITPDTVAEGFVAIQDAFTMGYFITLENNEMAQCFSPAHTASFQWVK